MRDDSPNDQLLMNELDDENEKNPEGGQAVNDARSDRMEEEELIRQGVDQGSIKNDTNIEPGQLCTQLCFHAELHSVSICYLHTLFQMVSYSNFFYI